MKAKDITTEIRTESGQTLRLTYAITEDGERGYGVSVSEESRGERAEARELTGDRQEAEQFLARLARCQVTAATLLDVANDWLCEKHTVSFGGRGGFSGGTIF